MPKDANPIDVHVGSRVKLRRMTLGVSQERLGRLLGLTFQQIQKYEKGSNRIGASRLFAIAQALNAPVQFFFEEMPRDVYSGLPPALNDSQGKDDAPDTKGVLRVADFVSTPEGLELNRHFHKITDLATRRHLAELVRSVASGSGNPLG